MEICHDKINLIVKAIKLRQGVAETSACRLFNGFNEGMPGLVIDRYDTALVILDHDGQYYDCQMMHPLIDGILEQIPGVKSVLIKSRQHDQETIRKGVLVRGDSLPGKINEFCVRYALDLQMNQDAGFYLDTRLLRRWLIDHSRDWRVLNTFAYTGSLGVAAGIGGAESVVQTDLNQSFLDVARRSWKLNGLAASQQTLIAGDFFRVAGRLRNQSRLFDCVILDPPYFSTTEAGRVDLQGGTSRLVNKIRPLVAHEGKLVVINNALYYSGMELMEELERLCQGAYLSLDSIIPVPQDVTGYPETIVAKPPADPAPFNHPTKIAVLSVFRKDQRK